MLVTYIFQTLIIQTNIILCLYSSPNYSLCRGLREEKNVIKIWFVGGGGGGWALTPYMPCGSIHKNLVKILEQQKDEQFGSRF